MNLNESIFQMMREGRRYSPGWIAKRNNLPLSSVRGALASLVRGGGGRENPQSERQAAHTLRNAPARPVKAV